jgi:HEAT repeat protein
MSAAIDRRAHFSSDRDQALAELEGPVASARASAATLLGEMGCSDAVPALIGRMTDPDAWVREQVASALIRLRDPRAKDALTIGLLRDPSADVRSACAQALGELGEAAVLTAAVETEQDPFAILLIERSLWRLENRR